MIQIFIKYLQVSNYIDYIRAYCDTAALKVHQDLATVGFRAVRPQTVARHLGAKQICSRKANFLTLICLNIYSYKP